MSATTRTLPVELAADIGKNLIMAVLAEYHSGNEDYARSANAAFSGFDEGQSMMARAQAMRLRDAQEERQQQEFVAKLPLIRATALQATVNAKSAVDNAVTHTNLETKAAAESVNAVKEFNDAIQYNAEYDVGASDGTPEGDAAQAEAGKYATQKTYEDRIAKLSALKAKYAYMANLKNEGYQAFYQSIDKALAQNNENLHVNLKIEELQAAAQARADATRYAADQGVVKEGIKAGAKQTSAEIYTGSRERIAAINNDTKLTMQEKAAKIATEKQGSTIADLQGRAADADQAAADASAAGDEQTAAAHRAVASSYRDAVQKSSTFAGQSPQAVPGKSPAPRPHAKPTESQPSPEIKVSIPGADAASTDQGATETPAVAPTKVPKDAKTIDVGGKTYPIWVDKNGKRAYKVDGHFVPVDTE